MFISVQDLEVKPLQFAEELPAGRIDFGSEISQQGTLSAKGRADLVEEHHGGKQTVQDIRFVGSFSGTFELACSRCLEAVKAKVGEDFDLLYRPLMSGKQGDEISINEAETEIGFFKGNGLELEDVIKEQVLLSLPVKPLCKEACKGLCPQCGQNLNTGKCDCTTNVQDPRWAALEALRDQLKKD
jgi:uncharacterized protein